jgi:2-dehydro-3-deoxyphosphogluconate aldolase/(4S)-4-hydroxy-2-oxoglutarate aldolase
MAKEECIEHLIITGVIAIMRAKTSDQLLKAADAIKAGGVNAIEVTITTPNALDVISKAVVRYESEVLFGVGSVLDPESARIAILAGAQFVVCPTLNVKTIKLCRRYSIPVMPGAYTPSEILKAWETGADIVKVFPASVGGPSYIRAVKAPLPQVKLMPVGGVNLKTTAEFIRAGCDVVAVGSALVDQNLLDERKFTTITERAVRFREEVEKGRAV